MKEYIKPMTVVYPVRLSRMVSSSVDGKMGVSNSSADNTQSVLTKENDSQGYSIWD